MCRHGERRLPALVVPSTAAQLDCTAAQSRGRRGRDDGDRLPTGLVTLEVTGRRSGRAISVPLVLVFVDGQRYLVSMLGDDVHWVQNIRAAGGRAALRTGGRREEVHLTEIPTGRRAPILKAYLRRAPGARAHVSVDKDAPLSEFERIAPSYPVFIVAGPPSK